MNLIWSLRFNKLPVDGLAKYSFFSCHLAWHPPHPDTLHGEFLGYKLSIRIRAEGSIPQIIMLKVERLKFNL